MGDMGIRESIERLKELISNYESLVVAFSGGMDSTFLVYVAFSVLQSKMIAITVDSPFSIKRELKFSKEFTRRYDIPHTFLLLNPLDSQEILDNDRLRCYYCKKKIFEGISRFAREHDYRFTADGSNLSDESDYRPGKRALEELGIVSPLVEIGFSKEMIREACEFLDLDIPYRYSNACLASRIPYGTRISKDILERIDDGESFIEGLGFSPVRLRYHDTIARVELSEDGMKRLLSNRSAREKIINKLKNLGFLYITIDIEGFRTGSLNLMLDD
jgi:uncharacterized protein